MKKKKLKCLKNKRKKGREIKNKCPNCGHELKMILNEWVCFECEYHSSLPLSKRIEKGSFR